MTVISTPLDIYSVQKPAFLSPQQLYAGISSTVMFSFTLTCTEFPHCNIPRATKSVMTNYKGMLI